MYGGYVPPDILCSLGSHFNSKFGWLSHCAVTWCVLRAINHVQTTEIVSYLCHITCYCARCIPCTHSEWVGPCPCPCRVVNKRQCGESIIVGLLQKQANIITIITRLMVLRCAQCTKCHSQQTYVRTRFSIEDTWTYRTRILALC